MPAFPDLFEAEPLEIANAGDAIVAAGSPLGAMELRGLVMGPDGSDCPPYPALKYLDGFGVPAGREATVRRALAHGLLAGRQYLDGRTMSALVAIRNDDTDTVFDLAADLAGVWQPVDPDLDGDTRTIPLVFALGGSGGVPVGLYRVDGLPQRCIVDYAPTFFWDDVHDGGPNFATALVEFLAVDPRIYSLDAVSVGASAGATSGGHGWPSFTPYVGFPHGFGSATPGGASLVNIGNFKTYVQLVIGPAIGGGITGFVVTHGETGKQFGMTIALADGEFLVIDTDRKTVLLNAIASRIGNVNRPSQDDWIELLPGANTITYTTSGSGSAPLTASWRHAWVL